MRADGPRARPTVRARLTWALRGARIIKHVSGPLNAEGTDVAVEELTLAYERLDMEVRTSPATEAPSLFVRLRLVVAYSRRAP